jgi:hypothetical protein
MFVVMVRVRHSGEGEERDLGTLSPPTVNGKPTCTADEGFRGKRSPDGKPVSVHDALDDLWAEWREEAERPDADNGEFVEWLVTEKGWRRAETEVVAHVVET